MGAEGSVTMLLKTIDLDAELGRCARDSAGVSKPSSRSLTKRI